jgi:hypothetical protein
VSLDGKLVSLSVSAEFLSTIGETQLGRESFMIRPESKLIQSFQRPMGVNQIRILLLEGFYIETVRSNSSV